MKELQEKSQKLYDEFIEELDCVGILSTDLEEIIEDLDKLIETILEEKE